MILYLKELLKKRQISSIDLSEALGVSKATVSYWLNGKVFPGPETLEKIANYLSIEIWELFKAPDDPPKFNGVTCPHCGKPIDIEIKKGSE